MTRAAAPPDLSLRSRAAWPGLVADVRAAAGGADVDLELCAEVLRCRDRLEQIRAVLRDEGLTIAGSKGQRRPHPLLSAETATRGAMLALLIQLKLTPARRRWNTRVERGRLVAGE